MNHPIESCSEKHRAEALAVLRAELCDFSHDGLVQLREDLALHSVARGSWSGCVISYKRGAPGSARRDSMGRARNAFTVLWDNGWLTDEEVDAMVADELAARVGSVPRPQAPETAWPPATSPPPVDPKGCRG